MEPDFWSDSEKAQGVMRDMRVIKDTVGKFESIEEDYEHLEIAYELSGEAGGKEYEKEVKKLLKTLQVKIDAMEIETMLSEPYDQHNAILTIHPGAGGTESQDWQKCFIVCIFAGQSKMVIKQQSSTILLVKKRK